MSHSSVVLMTFNGTKAYVYAALGGILAVNADGEHRGEVLWKTDAWDHKIVAPSPVQLGPERVLITSGHGAGSMILNLARNGTTWRVVDAMTLNKTMFASEQQTPLLVNGLLYAILGPTEKN